MIDFSVLKRVVRERCESLDHRFLLQRESRVLAIEETDDAWRFRTPDGRCYHMPKSDVVALPVDNTTTERLAQWFHREIAGALGAAGWRNLAELRVEIEEAPGQSGWYAAPV